LSGAAWIAGAAVDYDLAQRCWRCDGRSSVVVGGAAAAIIVVSAGGLFNPVRRNCPVIIGPVGGVKE